jgi:hypothetical protein
VTDTRQWRGGQTLSDGSRIFWWVEIVLVVTFYLVYTAIRNSTEGSESDAFIHARQLIDLQSAMGIFHEESLQDWALEFRPLVIAMNYFYGSFHLVFTGGVAVWLFLRHGNDYPLWRNTLLITTGLALVGFVTWPLMPPRLLPDGYGFVDTLAQYPTFWSFNSGAVSEISNQYAAMPSLHCSWALWCACVLIPRVRHRAVAIAAAFYPVVTVIAIVLTGNHYLLDAVGGFAVLGVGYMVARVTTRAGRGPVQGEDKAHVANREQHDPQRV